MLEAPGRDARDARSRPTGVAPHRDEPTLVAPTAVREIDVGFEAPIEDLWLPASACGESYRSLLLVVRLDGAPLGTAAVGVEPGGHVPRERLAHALLPRFDAEFHEVLANPQDFDGSPLPERYNARHPSISVVVTTCRNPGALERCLRSVLECDYHDFEIIVVENRPGSAATRRVLSERFEGEPRLRYVEEPRHGLSVARNAGLAVAQGELVAFIDDDVVVDPDWLARCAGAFGRARDVGCMTGLILPLELETQSQVLLEQFAGFGKGFEPRMYRLADELERNPLFAYTPGAIGSGANTVLSAEAARRLGGFDTTLGAGTPAAGGEDLDLYIRLLREGYAVAYEPSAIVWHQHPDGEARLRRQVYRYGVAQGALLTKQLVAGPSRRQFLTAVPAGVRYARDPASRKNAGKQADYPRRLDWLERLGMAAGPAAYALSAAKRRLHNVRGEGAALNLHVDRLAVGTGRVVDVVSFRERVPLTQTARVRQAPRGWAERTLVATAATACVLAPLLVALGVPPALRLPAVLAMLCLAPGTALLATLRGTLEPGLVVAASLAGTAVVAQAMLWLGAWWPEPVLYVLAAACFPVLIGDFAFRARAGGVASWVASSRKVLRGISRSTLEHAGVVGLSVLVWILSIPAADLAEIDGFGLLSALPPTYFLAFGVLLGGFGVAVSRPAVDPRALALYVVALVVVMHATTPLLYDEPRYTWTFTHLGVIDLIATHGGVDRSIDIYNNWPGFFAANAWLSTVAGVGADIYAEWAQVFFSLLAVAALRFALRGVTSDERLLWTAAWLFVLGNWVGQEYLAPQAFGFFLSLVVLGLALRCAPSPSPARYRLDRWWRARLGRLRAVVPRAPPSAERRARAPLAPRAALVIGGICYVAVVISHQLSPILLLFGVAALALLVRRVPLWVPAAMAVVEAGWLLQAWAFLSERFELFDPDPGAGTGPPGYSVGDGLPGLTVVTVAARAAVVLVVVLAAIGVVRRLRAGHLDLAALSLALAPGLIVGVQSYGGEGRFRVYLFALPWLSFFAAAACLAAPISRLSRSLHSLRPAVAGVALGTCLLFAYFGLELVNHPTKDDVAASTWFDNKAPHGSLLVGVTPSFPTRLTARYPLAHNRDYTASPSLSDEERVRGRRLSSADLPRIERTLRGYGVPNVFLMLTRGQERFARLYGVFPAGSLARLDRALRASPSFRRVYEHGSSAIYAYRPAERRP
jgi:GT2 family glycosyltransferase